MDIDFVPQIYESIVTTITLEAATRQRSKDSDLEH
jgi:hypothetical protein